LQVKDGKIMEKTKIYFMNIPLCYGLPPSPLERAGVR
jgi:hypothetical protein